MAERFFLTEPVEGHTAVLVGDEAHHLSRVMRAKVGDHVGLFDGYGHHYEASVQDVSKKQVTLRILSAAFDEDTNSPEISVAVCLPKGDRQKFLVEKLVELGANRLIPLETSRSIVEANDRVLKRLEKQVVEASKQCRRNWLMKIEPPSGIESLVACFAHFNGHRMLADPNPNSDDLLPQSHDAPVVVAIGPEGGFSADESQQFVRNDWKTVCFGPNVMRIETAAMAAVAILRTPYTHR